VLTTAITGRPIPCWECLKPAAQATDGHPYRATRIGAGVPQQMRYTPAQEDRRGKGGGAGAWEVRLLTGCIVSPMNARKV